MLTTLYVRTQNWLKSDEGATAVEYGIMASLIAAVIITVVTTLGGQVAAMFQVAVNALLSVG